MSKKAYLIDVDNTSIDTEGLFRIIDQLCQDQYQQQIQSGDLPRVYNTYKTREGKVNMPEILAELADEKGITGDARTRLMKIYEQVDIVQSGLLMDPGHTLIRKLGWENIFFLTMGDSIYQDWKLRHCGLPPDFVDDKVHVDIRPVKGPEDTQGKIAQLKAMGYDEIYVINDRLDQLKDAFAADPEAVHCILIPYGKYTEQWQSKVGEGPFADNLTVVREYHDLYGLLLPPTDIETGTQKGYGELKK